MVKSAHVLVSVSKSTCCRRWINALCFLVIVSMTAAMTACANAFPGTNDTTSSEMSGITNSTSSETSAITDSTSIESDYSETSGIEDIFVSAKVGIFEKDGKSFVLGGEALYPVEGVIYPGIFDAQYSVDQTQAAFLTDYTEGQGGTLVYANETQYITIAENVVSYYLSSDGSTIAYLTGPYDESVGGALYKYSGAANKSVWVTDHAGQMIVLSPSGTSIGYYVISKDASANIINTGCYSTAGGAPKQVGVNSYVTALTDDADIVYILVSDSETYTVCALHDGEYTQYSSCPAYAGGYTCFVFNRDGTQVIFNDGFEVCRYSQNAAPSQKILDSMSCGPLGESSFRRLSISENAGVHVIYTPAQNLPGILYTAQSSLTYELELVRFDEDMKSTTKEIEGFIEGKNDALTRFAYVKDNKSLMLLENPFDGGSTAINLTDDVMLGQIDMASDGTLYYLTNTNDLFVVRSGNIPVLLKNDVTGMYLMENDKSCTLFYISDYKEKTSDLSDALGTKSVQFGRTLYSLDNNEGSVPAALADYVDSINGDVYGIVYTAISQITQDKYTCGSTTECYYTSDGKSFEKIL